MTNIEKAFVGSNQVAQIRIGDQVVWPEYAGRENMVLWYDTMGKTNNDLGRGVLEDLSGNNNHGELRNFAYTNDSGYDDGLVFDGVDDDVIILNIDETIQSQSVEVIFSGLNEDEARESIIVGGETLNAYKVSIEVRNYQGIKQVSAHYPGSAVPLYSNIAYSGEIIHVVATSSISEGLDKLYINSELVASRVSFFVDPYLLNSLYIGRGFGYHKGGVKDTRILKRALTPTEIQQNYLIDKARWDLP